MNLFYLTFLLLVLNYNLISQTESASYYFDGNSEDNSGNGRHLIGKASLTSDRFNNSNSAYFFDGQTDHFLAEKSIDLTSNFSISVWIKPEMAEKWSMPVCVGNSFLNIRVSFDPKIQKTGFSGWYSGATGIEHSKQILEFNRWYHIVGVRSNNNWRLYINGALDRVPAGHNYTAQHVIIAISRNADYRQDYFRGEIDDIKIYNKALMPDEVLELYNENRKSENIRLAQNVTSLPPLLKIEEINLSQSIIKGGTSEKLTIKLKNAGPGDANNVYAELSSNTKGLSFPQKTYFKQIKKEGGVESISVNIAAGMELISGEGHLDIKIVETDFNIKIQSKRLIFTTKEFLKPNLIIAKYSILEGTSASPNNQIDINEIVDLKLAIQNVGEGAAENVRIEVSNSQKGVMFLGSGEGSEISTTFPVFNQILPGKFETVNFRYFINSDFEDRELFFNININEKHKKFGITDKKSIAINTEQKDEGYIRKVEIATIDESKKIIIEDIPDFEIDIRKDIPSTSIINNDAVAIIIGNKDYRQKDIPSVDYAIDDAMITKQYLINALGYKEGNIIYVTNAAQGDFISIFGTKDNHKGRLFNYVKESKSDVFVYYSGHGAPDPESRQGYFVPVDCDPSLVALNGYSLNTFYENLSKINYKSLTVVIDACFSGSSDKGTLLKNISPVFIQVDNPVISSDNTIVFASASGDQVSSWYPEKRHSLFTYYFLKGLKGEADLNNDKKVTIGEMKEYILDNVPYMARRLNNREQTPQVIGEDSEVLIKY